MKFYQGSASRPSVAGVRRLHSMESFNIERLLKEELQKHRFTEVFFLLP